MLNLAFIGSEAAAARYGSITNRIHGARWLAYVSIDQAQASMETKGKSHLGAAIEASSVDDLVNHHLNEIEAMVIEAPSESLSDLVKTAAQANKPILAGPLLAKQTEELNTLIQTLGTATLMPTCAWRFVPAIQSVKARVEAGNLGEIGLIRLHRWNSTLTESHYDLPDRIIPDIDLATWLFGSQPTKIFSLKSPRVDQYLQLHLYFENGGMAVIDETAALPDGGNYFSLTVIGGTGAVYADDHRNMNLIVDGVYPHAIRTEQGVINIAQQLQAFVNALSSGSLPAFPQQDVLNVLQVSDAVLDILGTNKVSVWEDGHYVSQ